MPTFSKSFFLYILYHCFHNKSPESCWVKLFHNINTILIEWYLFFQGFDLFPFYIKENIYYGPGHVCESGPGVNAHKSPNIL